LSEWLLVSGEWLVVSDHLIFFTGIRSCAVSRPHKFGTPTLQHSTSPPLSNSNSPPPPMNLNLIDLEWDLVDAWRTTFAAILR